MTKDKQEEFFDILWSFVSSVEEIGKECLSQLKAAGFDCEHDDLFDLVNKELDNRTLDRYLGNPLYAYIEGTQGM